MTVQDRINKLRSTAFFQQEGRKILYNEEIRNNIVNDLILLAKQIQDLSDSVTLIGSNHSKKIVSYAAIVGDSSPGIVIDNYFASVSNATKQTLLLKSNPSLIPLASPITLVQIQCINSISSGEAYCELGRQASGDEYMTVFNLKSTGSIISASGVVSPISTDSGVYLSITPTVNWNTLTTGIWKITIYYNDNTV